MLFEEGKGSLKPVTVTISKTFEDLRIAIFKSKLVLDILLKGKNFRFRKSRLLKAVGGNNNHITNKDLVRHITWDTKKMYHFLQPQNK